MTNHNWPELLRRWNAELLSDPGITDKLPDDAETRGWLGYPGATEDQIVRAEERLGAKLPPSYREFLRVTNGWRSTGYFIGRLWPIEEVQWFNVRNRQWIDAYEDAGISPVPDDEYFVYGAAQDGFLTMRVEYLETALEISDIGDSCIYLLNPKVITPDGEWEAWFFSNWGGANRYRSFREMMHEEHKAYLSLRDQK